MQPSFVIPTAISFGEANGRTGAATSSSLDEGTTWIGDEATSQSVHGVQYPIRHGVVDNWSNMERFWQQAIHRCDHSKCSRAS